MEKDCSVKTRKSASDPVPRLPALITEHLPKDINVKDQSEDDILFLTCQSCNRAFGLKSALEFHEGTHSQKTDEK